MKRLLQVIALSLGVLALAALVMALAWSARGLRAAPLTATAPAASQPAAQPGASTPAQPRPTPAASRPVRPRPTELVMTPIPPEPGEVLEGARQITSRPAPRGLLAVDGNYAVWRSHEDGGTHIVAYDFRSGQERRLSILEGGKSMLRISGDYVVWADTASTAEGPLSVVRAYDLQAGREIAMGAPTKAQTYPDVSGHILVWNDRRNHSDAVVGDIYGYDLQKGEEFPVVVGPGLHAFPRIDGQWVIYVDWPAGTEPLTFQPGYQPTLRAHNLATGEDLAVGQSYYSESDAFVYAHHMISGQRVVWLGADGKYKVYDLASRQTRKLAVQLGSGPQELHGGLMRLGARLANVETGAALDFFHPYQAAPGNPAPHLDEVASDGQTVLWSFDAGGEGRIYAAHLKRQP